HDIGQPRADQEQSGEAKTVGQCHPRRGNLGESEVGLDRRQGDIHHRDIQHDDQLSQTRRPEPKPLQPSRHYPSLIRLYHVVRAYQRRRWRGVLMTESTRRTEIMEAVERLLARGGLNAVTMRAVAAEADVSLRLVQYYGSTKDELLSATLDRLADKSVERWQARSRRQGYESPLEVIKAFYDEALPTDRV